MPNPTPPDSDRIRATFAAERGPFRLGVALDLPNRGITALFGPSGSGKTTCLRLLAGLERARGSAWVSGVCWQDDERGVFVPTHQRAVGFVFQDASLFPHLTVRGNLEYGRTRAGASARPADFSSIVELLGISALLDRRPLHLSGGERQRVAIARALLAAPRLLLMDEPLASLDAARKADILPYLERLRDELAVPILYVSHALEEVARLASTLVVLDAGAVAASGRTAETLARLDLPMARADDAAVVLDTTVAQHDEADHLTRLDFEGGSLWAGRVDRPLGARVRVRVFARDVSLAREAPPLSSILNVIEARVEELGDGGLDRMNVRLSVGPAQVPLLARITRRSCDALGVRPGVALHALVKTVALVA